MNSIYTRRSVRKFKEDKVEDEKITQLLKAGMQAPTSMNQQAHEFIVVTDKDVLEKVSTYKKGGQLVLSAPMCIIVLFNEEVAKAPLMWQQDSGAVAQNILLEAVNLDLGAVWMSCAPLEERMKFFHDYFNLPATLKPYCVIPVGYPLEDDANKFIDRFDENKVHYNKYK